MDSDYEFEFVECEAAIKNPGVLHQFLFTRGGKPAFIVGKEFTLIFALKNIDERDYPADHYFKVRVDWANGAHQTNKVSFGSVKSGDLVLRESEFEILDTGYGVIRFEDTDFKVKLDDTWLEEEFEVKKVFGQTIEEFYQYWAMIVAAVGLIYPVVKDILRALNTIFS
ncbi:MAG: hypothetical protein NWE89_01910 [Candidatus Bathyarchaeota archaeon]|nr:hypothetical protein [Candidatus Bathyarchaeota archaeon]